jgi:hypothetical protein
VKPTLFPHPKHAEGPNALKASAPLGGTATPWPLDHIRPTQMCVGWREVARKRRGLRVGGSAWIANRTIPVVLGQSSTAYALDRHHRLCAMAAEGVCETAVYIVDDLSDLDEPAFWRLLDKRGWCRLLDRAGVPQPLSKMATKLASLADDPLRSLAGSLRRHGGYTKCDGPFSEFRWADYLRLYISPAHVLADYVGATALALELAGKWDARDLPGWRAASVAPSSAPI